MDYEDRASRYDQAETTISRFGRWLSKRPGESWAFFIAGMIIAGILF
ncbi:MAG: hypothetical protein AAGK23_02615 [Pseudomonadota bacterium]